MTILCFSHGLVTKPCSTLVTPQTVAQQASLSIGFTRQEYWNGLPFHSPGDLLHPGIEHESPAWQVDSLPLSHLGSLQVTLCCAKLLSRVWLSVTLWTIAWQAPRSRGILQARILEWVAMVSSRGSFQPRDWTWVSCFAGRLFTFRTTREAPEKVTSMALEWTISFLEKKQGYVRSIHVFWHLSQMCFDI